MVFLSVDRVGKTQNEESGGGEVWTEAHCVGGRGRIRLGVGNWSWWKSTEESVRLTKRQSGVEYNFVSWTWRIPVKMVQLA